MGAQIHAAAASAVRTRFYLFHATMPLCGDQRSIMMIDYVGGTVYG